MTILAIDAGNTRIKWGLHDGAQWLRQGAVSTAESERLRDELQPADRVVIANVAGERVRKTLAAAVAGAGTEPYWGRGGGRSSAGCAAVTPSPRSSEATAGPH